ncbi:hypothetical protein [Paraburkholderia sp. J8-2]|uniref:hypothetical protein n=1 Tax=Paraburkholderia sp. J8-2 TaxID=2805440 RepID=UPI002AB7E5A1|nr:hypothetical protein [Paraburkholderia sp. J8-2]
MTAPEGIFTSNGGSVDLNNFQLTLAAKFTLPPLPTDVPLPWVIIGKAVIENFDGDPQNATAQLLLDDVVIDSDEIRLAGCGDGPAVGQCVSLQAAFRQTLKQAALVEMKCSTYIGRVIDTKLAAISLSTLHTV